MIIRSHLSWMLQNVAFLDYMTMAVLPKHLLEGEDMQTSDFFRNPIGTGPYITGILGRRTGNYPDQRMKNYFKGEPNIDTVVFKDSSG